MTPWVHTPTTTAFLLPSSQEPPLPAELRRDAILSSCSGGPISGPWSTIVRMDQSRKRAREGEEDVQPQARGTTTTRRQAAPRQEEEEEDDVAAEVADALMTGRGAVGEDEPWQRPPGVFELPWQKYRGGLGLASSAAGGVPELRDVFFRSLVDGGAATIGVPGDRLTRPASSKLTPKLFEDVEAWLASADDGEVDDPMWRSALAGPPRAGAEAGGPRVTPK